MEEQYMQFVPGVTGHPWEPLSEAVGEGAPGLVVGHWGNEYGEYYDLEFSGYGAVMGIPADKVQPVV